jgi:primosomal protein N' (replication factor Y)
VLQGVERARAMAIPKEDSSNLYARVAVALPVAGTFLYALPDRLASRARVGSRIMVPFRSRTVTGYIIGKERAGQELSVREVTEIVDTEPLFHEGLVPFFQWMADYYLHPIGRFIQSALPGGINARSFKTAMLTEKGEEILGLLPAHSEERRILSWIGENPGKRLRLSVQLADAFQKRGWVVVETRSRDRRIGPLKRLCVKPRMGVTLDFVLRGGAGPLGAKNEVELLELAFQGKEILLKDLTARFPNGPYLVSKWLRRNVLETHRTTVFRDPSGNIIPLSPQPGQLYEQQEKALSSILKPLGRGVFSAFLLYGVTGSGKTEVYFRAIEHCLGLGRQAILMFPEIALSIYMEGLFRARLSRRIAIYHSGLSEGERYDQWMRIVRGEADLVIGARSALFAPLPQLGLIIVDEEHDLSYKQEESPRYQARDAALVRGRMENALVILGSGTPSVQSYHNALTGKYILLTMPERIEKRPLPEVSVIDMKQVSKTKAKSEIVSCLMREALEQTLAEGNQAILFLNRRGFNRVHLCRSCGQAVRCPNCDVALIYHLRENDLSCHYCGYRKDPRPTCPHCGHDGLKAYGFGTERLERELKELFPGKNIARLDRDVIRRKGQTFEILKQFAQYEIDIMVGTQMITKGYDFPKVTLVGVIAADASLAFPDFRAAERTFQVLSQVAGRAGRGDQKGRVIVQTFNPDHYAVTSARDHDYRGFFEKERELREQLGYPPFSYLACLRLQGNNKNETTEKTQLLAWEMGRITQKWPKRGKEIQILGPVEAPLAKLRGKHRWQIFVKCKRRVLLHLFLKEVTALSEKILRATGVKLIIDVDPYQML